MSNALITIFLGGGIGSVMRFGVQAVMNGRIPPLFFPWATLGVNVAGSFLIETRLFLTTGLCGGFTTFSTFSQESLTLLRQGHYAAFALYTLASVAAGIAAALAGGWVGKAHV